MPYLGRLDESRDALDRFQAQSPEQLQRWQQKPPWVRPEDSALLVEGAHLAAGKTP